MKNIQPYIIAGMTILIVVLFWRLYSMNSTVEEYKEAIELSKLKTAKKSVQKQTYTVITDLIEKSESGVKKSNSIIKKITYEIPKIADTTDYYMLEYIKNYRPETN